MRKRKRRHYKSTIKRVALIREITAKHYEPGNHLRSYKAVWKKWINPVYPMAYDTYLRLLSIKEDEVESDAAPGWKQMTIFDVL